MHKDFPCCGSACNCILSTASPSISRMRSSNRIVLLSTGDSHTLECTAKGHPSPTVQWRESDDTAATIRNASYGPNATYDDLPDVTSTLTLENVVPELTHTFHCHAFNEEADYRNFLGEATSSVQVLVLGKL